MGLALRLPLHPPAVMAAPGVLVIDAAAAVEPAAFWRDAVHARRPALLTGLHHVGTAFDARQWTLEALAASVGGAVVDVEHRDTGTGSFGTGVKTRMRFGEFAARVSGGDEALYLTTQRLPEDEDGLPTVVCGQPLTSLPAGVLPLALPLAGRLALSSVNLWLGASRSGSSSGLHHDYHDNLYLLLRGRKRFTVAAPDAAFRMYLRGPVLRVHGNGLINYRGSATREDGTLPEVALAAARAHLARATARGAGGGAPAGEVAAARERVRRCEAEVAAAARAEAAAPLHHDDDGGSEAEGGDDDDGGDDGVGGGSGGGAASEVAAMWAAMRAAAGPAASPAGGATVSASGGVKRRRIDGSGAVAGDDRGARPAKRGGPAAPRAGATAAVAGAATAADSDSDRDSDSGSDADGPPHFSRVPLAALRREAEREAAAGGSSGGKKRRRGGSGGPQSTSTARREYPLFCDVALQSVDVVAGQILYLPASWFHEVQSFAEGDGDTAGASVHCALNYWFWPPCSSGTCEAPYADALCHDIADRTLAATFPSAAGSGGSGGTGKTGGRGR